MEGKNGAIIREHLGYGYIVAEHAPAVQRFHTTHLNPYLKFPRLCGFATVSRDERSKRKRLYKLEDYATPYEKLKELQKAERYLKPNRCFSQLDQTARQMSDTECARKMTAAKMQMLRRCQSESPLRPPR